MKIVITADCISVVSLVITVALGTCALWQAKRYNDASQRTNDDTKFMMMQQIYLINSLLKSNGFGAYKSHQKLCLAKDKIYLHKFSSYQKNNCDSIMQEIHKLSIKERFMDGIKEYLLSDEMDYACNFWGGAEFKENIDETFLELYSILLKYDISVIINNKIW